MKTTTILLAALALTLGAPLSASAETPAAAKAQKPQKIHTVSHGARTPAKAAATPKEKAVKLRMAQEPDGGEPVYDYASCGCS
jgi:hypothetical protein